MSKHLRKRKFVDRDVQGRLVAAALKYWTMSLLIVAGLSIVGWVFVYPGIGTFLTSNSPGTTYVPMFVAAMVVAILMVPVAVVDLIRQSHRFAGPIVRLRRAMSELSAGGDPGPLEFRDNDYWHDLAAQFNAVRDHVRELRGEQPRRTTSNAAATAEIGADSRHLADSFKK